MKRCRNPAGPGVTAERWLEAKDTPVTQTCQLRSKARKLK